jgi:pimeloyl-ACP methyl ester carboxylesterase
VGPGTLTGVMPNLPVPGANLYFQDAGGAGTPVVFLHPASGSADSWQLQLPVFQASGYRTITYDLRGWARSRPDPSVSDPGCMSDDLLALVDHLSLDTFVLIAAAYGGFGGVDFALRFPNRLQAFVLSGSQGGIADPSYTATRERVVSAPIRGLPIELRELGPSYRTRDPEGVRRWLEVGHAAGEPPSSARQRMHEQIQLPMLARLSVPTLMIAGGADLLAPAELMRHIAAYIPGHEFVTVGEAGHCIHWEQPDDWNRAVLDFLGKHRTGA